MEQFVQDYLEATYEEIDGLWMFAKAYAEA